MSSQEFDKQIIRLLDGFSLGKTISETALMEFRTIASKFEIDVVEKTVTKFLDGSLDRDHRFPPTVPEFANILREKKGKGTFYPGVGYLECVN